MKIIVGLGNPGVKYVATRHNVGFEVLERLAFKLQLRGFKLRDKFKAEMVIERDMILVKPMTFMNRSGEAVKKTIDFYKIALEDLYVVYDDLDIKLGEYKIQIGKGPKIHNGLNSIREALRGDQFWHIRVGVDNRNEGQGTKGISGEDYILDRFLVEEKSIISEVIGKVVNEMVSKYL